MEVDTLATRPEDLLATILQQAVAKKATDIHFTPQEDTCLIRIRVDGLLRDLITAHGKVVPDTVSYIKTLANLDLTQQDKPQEGRFLHFVVERNIDFRVSIFPTLHGDSVVLRVLDHEAKPRTIEHLGLFPRQFKLLRSFLSHSSGLLLITGPTGAGKTTSLYAALLELVTPEKNIIAIEDVIEHDLPRILQTSIQPQLGINYAGLLKSALRHDPDVIMVADIPDEETAETILRASFAGLVLASVHTQCAVEAITSLFNLGIKPYVLSSLLRGIISQRLVRKICHSCKTSFEYGDEILNHPDFSDILPQGSSPSFSLGLGCDVCLHSGYQGRRGIFEVLEVEEDIQKLILDAADVEEIENKAIAKGMLTLRKSGFQAVLEGLTTIEEVARNV